MNGRSWTWAFSFLAVGRNAPTLQIGCHTFQGVQMTKIVFTSCMDAERVPEQPVWDQIRAEAPDVLMLLGDQIYMDWGDLGGSDWRRLIDRRPSE